MALSPGDRVVGAAAASSRISVKPVPHPKEEGQVRPAIGWRVSRGLVALVGSATNPRA